jgi:hypothetical protein
MAATGIPSRSSLLPLRTLSPGGVAHRPTSLTQSNTAQSQQPTGNTDKGFPKRFNNHWMISRHDFGTGSTHRLAQLFPNNKDSSTRVQHRVSFLYQDYTKVSCRLAFPLGSRSGQMDRMAENPPSRLTASVLFACTRVDTCHPGNCMRSIRTPSSPTWEITGPSKRT